MQFFFVYIENSSRKTTSNNIKQLQFFRVQVSTLFSRKFNLSDGTGARLCVAIPNTSMMREGDEIKRLHQNEGCDGNNNMLRAIDAKSIERLIQQS